MMGIVAGMRMESPVSQSKPTTSSTGDHNIDRSLRKPYTLGDVPRETWYLMIELEDGSKVTLETLIYGVSLSGWMSGYDMKKWRVEHEKKLNNNS
jgi:hypothetical protein